MGSAVAILVVYAQPELLPLIYEGLHTSSEYFKVSDG